MKYKNLIEIDVGRVLRQLLKRWKLIVLISLLFFGIGYALTLEPGTDLYGASSTVYSAYTGSYQTSLTGVGLMNDYMDVATSYKVCERAAILIGRDDINGEKIQSMISVAKTDSIAKVSAAADSTTISITAISSNPVLCMEVADAVADAFVMEVCSILGNNDAVQNLDRAHKYVLVSNAMSKCWQKRFIFLAVGFGLSVCMIVALEIFNATTKTVREGSLYGNLPIIGVIPQYKK